jgi:hypothetical protein
MNLSALRSQVSALKAQMPPPPGRPLVQVFARKGPRPAGAPADTETVKRWYCRDLATLEELRAKFDREYGPRTRGPNDLPCLFFRMISRQEIFEEQYRGTKYEHLWPGGAPTADEVAS